MGEVPVRSELQAGIIVIRSLTILLLTLSMQVYAQQMQLEVISLDNRTTDQVIPVIRPLLVPGGSVNGMNNQLIVKTTPANLAEIKQILQTIDRPLRSLMITVQQGIDRSEYLQGGRISGEVGYDDVTLSNRSAQAQSGGVIISGRDSKGNVIRYNNTNTRTSTDNNHTYSVQTLEGEPAFIQTGQSVPLPNRNTIITRNGVVVQDTVEYHDARSGFYVMPRISGNTVTLMIAPRLTTVNQGRLPTFDVQSVETTISGRLGEWIEIGGLNRSERGNNSNIGGSGNRQVDEHRTVLIKVVEIR